METCLVLLLVHRIRAALGACAPEGVPALDLQLTPSACPLLMSLY